MKRTNILLIGILVLGLALVLSLSTRKENDEDNGTMIWRSWVDGWGYDSRWMNATDYNYTVTYPYWEWSINDPTQIVLVRDPLDS